MTCLMSLKNIRCHIFILTEPDKTKLFWNLIWKKSAQLTFVILFKAFWLKVGNTDLKIARIWTYFKKGSSYLWCCVLLCISSRSQNGDLKNLVLQACPLMLIFIPSSHFSKLWQLQRVLENNVYFKSCKLFQEAWMSWRACQQLWQETAGAWCVLDINLKWLLVDFLSVIILQHSWSSLLTQTCLDNCIKLFLLKDVWDFTFTRPICASFNCISFQKKSISPPNCQWFQTYCIFHMTCTAGCSREMLAIVMRPIVR